jgi:chromosome segregation ATPase
MTNEEMQRAMEFTVTQQAQSSAKIDALAEAQNRAEERWTKTEESIRALLNIAEIHEREINALGQGISNVSQEILNLGETTRATDERLNALINVVERQISEGRNGKSR